MASTTLDVKVNFCSLDTRGKPHEEGNGHFAVPIKPVTLPWKQVPALPFVLAGSICRVWFTNEELLGSICTRCFKSI